MTTALVTLLICTFALAPNRHTAWGSVVWEVQVNVPLVGTARKHLVVGSRAEGGQKLSVLLLVSFFVVKTGLGTGYTCIVSHLPYAPAILCCLGVYANELEIIVCTPSYLLYPLPCHSTILILITYQQHGYSASGSTKLLCFP